MLRELILGPVYFQKKKIIKRTEFTGRENLKNHQLRMLKEILTFTIDYIPYYQKFIRLKKQSRGMEPEELLNEFPIINKDWIYSRLSNLVVGNKLQKLKGTTGGTTGQPLVFFMDRFYTRQAEKAFMFDQWSRVNYKFGDKIYNIRGRIPNKGQFVHHDRIFNIFYASSFELNYSNLPKYIDSINQIKPDFLHGYPSTAYLLASMIENSSSKLTHSFRAILCCSEKLFDFQRKIIQKVFKCPVYTWYGHSEYLALGGACEYSNKLHFYPQYGYTELLPTGKFDQEGNEIHEIVATGFNNRVMPIIRYRTGDYAIKSSKQFCKCGRDYLLIDEVIGRIQEFVVDKKNQLISATSLLFGQHYRAFQDLASIQFYQDTPGKLVVNVVKHLNCREKMLTEMKKQMESLIGDRMEIYINQVNSVEKTDIGKAKTVIQKLPVQEYL